MGKNNTKAIVIVHGKSEYAIAQYIKSNLRLPIEIVGKNKGRESIQINSLKNLFNSRDFKSITNFKKKYPNIEFKKKVAIGFKIFIIMDLDDADDSAVDSFLKGTMFKDYWFSEYVVPIFNDKNLEDVLKDMKYPYAKKKSQKGNYLSVFPSVNCRGADREQIALFSDKLRRCKKTNMHLLTDYCLEQTVKY